MRKPHDNDTVKADPCDTTDQGDRIVIGITLAEWIWNGDVLEMSKRHHKNVPNDSQYLISLSFIACWARGGVAVFVNGFIYELIDNALWNCLWLTHHLLLQQNVLPVLFYMLFFAVVAKLVMVANLLLASHRIVRCGYF